MEFSTHDRGARGRLLRAAGAVGHHSNDDSARSRFNGSAGRPILALQAGFDVRCANRAGTSPTPHVQTMLPHPLGPVGFSNFTSSPGLDCETDASELDSQAKRSRKRTPLRAMGSLTEICFKMSKLACSTPTAKNLNFFPASPS